MLQKSTVEPQTFSILKKLMSIEALKDFYLVGGTCLSLRYGHRKSIDLDLFATRDFNIEEIITAINNSDLVLEYTKRNLSEKMGIFGFINNVKIDLIKSHYFKQIDKPVIEEGIRMFGDRDIMAMKVFAILQRAVKKDFWDIAELLKKYTIQNFIDSYQEKYPSNQMLISIPHALTYFTDADESEDPISLKGQTWESVKLFIQKKVREYIKD